MVVAKNKKWLLSLGAFLILATALYLAREPTLIGTAAASTEARPNLLSDAQWGQPASAKKFSERFHAGVASFQLVKWLSQNQFETDLDVGKAVKMVGGIPCQERIIVQWTASDGVLTSATASVSEAGCL